LVVRAAVTTADAPGELASLLVELESELRRQHCPLVERLAPGRSAQGLEIGPDRGWELPDEARVWWSWHDGAPGTYVDPPDFALGGSWVLLSLDEALARLDWSREIASMAVEPGMTVEDLWPRSWLPITRAVNGDCITVDTAAPRGSPSTTRLFRQGDVELVAAALPSLAALIDVWLQALRTGAWRYEPGWGWHNNPRALPAPFECQRFL
jgi:hypothetical protein